MAVPGTVIFCAVTPVLSIAKTAAEGSTVALDDNCAVDVMFTLGMLNISN